MSRALPAASARRRRVERLILTTSIAAGAACANGGDPTPVVVATTTSVEDSGLMDALVAGFDSTMSGISVRVLAVGSGEALALGRRGDADLLITHAPDQEAKFVEAGHGTSPVVLMHNHFVIAGPADDPAGVREAATAAEAFTRIARAGVPFLSRGDSSGTHKRELRVWTDAGVHPDVAGTPWYIESGVGMGDLLRVAAERQAYTLSDRATFLMLGAQTGLEILFDDGGALLYNPYTATLVTAGRNQAAARTLHDWLQNAGREVIARYGVERYGRPLFMPGPGD